MRVESMIDRLYALQLANRKLTQPIKIPLTTPASDTNLQETTMKDKFVIKDSGKREAFDGGMVRDTQEDKTDFTRAIDGPMFERLAAHLTKGETKYPDVTPGVPNWTLAAGEAELVRFKKSAFRHFYQWYCGDIDEDHAAAVFFNINGAEYVKAKLKK